MYNLAFLNEEYKSEYFKELEFVLEMRRIQYFYVSYLQIRISRICILHSDIQNFG